MEGKQGVMHIDILSSEKQYLQVGELTYVEECKVKQEESRKKYAVHQHQIGKGHAKASSIEAKIKKENRRETMNQSPFIYSDPSRNF